MQLKTCTKCNCSKSKSQFSKDRHKPDGLYTVCKQCKSHYRSAYYKKNKERAIAQNMEWESKNRERVRQRAKAMRKRRRDEFLEWRRSYYRNKLRSDPSYKSASAARSMLKRVLCASGRGKDFCTFKSIGYTNEKLIERMEAQFSAGMNWDNYGDWEIDHKIPVSVMIRRGETRPEIINALSNLQPMWKSENREKGARRIG